LRDLYTPRVLFKLPPRRVYPSADRFGFFSSSSNPCVPSSGGNYLKPHPQTPVGFRPFFRVDFLRSVTNAPFFLLGPPPFFSSHLRDRVLPFSSEAFPFPTKLSACLRGFSSLPLPTHAFMLLFCPLSKIFTLDVPPKQSISSQIRNLLFLMKMSLGPRRPPPYEPSFYYPRLSGILMFLPLLVSVLFPSPLAKDGRRFFVDNLCRVTSGPPPLWIGTDGRVSLY